MPAPAPNSAALPGLKRLPLRRGRTLAVTLALCASLLPSATLAAGICNIDSAALKSAISDLRRNYETEPDFGCKKPEAPGQKLLCRDMMMGDKELWKMSQLDDMAWAYAYSNATATEHNPDNPQRDQAFIEKRNACEDEACLCAAFIEHTNDSMGGMSPYPQ